MGPKNSLLTLFYNLINTLFHTGIMGSLLPSVVQTENCKLFVKEKFLHASILFISNAKLSVVYLQVNMFTPTTLFIHNSCKIIWTSCDRGIVKSQQADPPQLYTRYTQVFETYFRAPCKSLKKNHFSLQKALRAAGGLLNRASHWTEVFMATKSCLLLLSHSRHQWQNIQREFHWR